MKRVATVLFLAVFTWPGLAAAQAPAPAAEAPAAAAPAKPRPAARRPAAPRPAGALTIINARDVAATQVAVVADGKTIRAAKPVAPNGRSVLKLPKLKGCMVTVAAAFQGDDEVSEVGEVDVCREKSVRLTDG